MILWIALFLLVISISFVLAVQSMRDFTHIPDFEKEYGLFLIRNTSALNKHLLDVFIDYLAKSGAYISFERLFKGNKSTLVIFGPKTLLAKYDDILNLLELEDYTKVELENISAWEVGVKNNGQRVPEGEMDPPSGETGNEKLFSHMPMLLENEEFWWQVIFSGSLKPQILGVVVTNDTARKHVLSEGLYNLAPDLIFKLPKSFSSEQLLDIYKKRGFVKENKNPKLIPEKILELFLIKD